MKCSTQHISKGPIPQQTQPTTWIWNIKQTIKHTLYCTSHIGRQSPRNFHGYCHIGHLHLCGESNSTMFPIFCLRPKSTKTIPTPSSLRARQQTKWWMLNATSGQTETRTYRQKHTYIYIDIDIYTYICINAPELAHTPPLTQTKLTTFCDHSPKEATEKFTNTRGERVLIKACSINGS